MTEHLQQTLFSSDWSTRFTPRSTEYCTEILHASWGRDTVEHHTHLIELCAKGDTEHTATVSGSHWRHLGGLIEDLFERAELV